MSSAPTPPACGHKASRFVNGEVPGIPEIEGHVSLARESVAFGEIDGQPGGDAAAIISCNAGGVPWPDILAFWGANTELLGAVNLADVRAPGLESGSNTPVFSIAYKDGAIRLEWMTQQEWDANADATLDYSATFTWSRGKIVTRDLEFTTEVSTAERFVKAGRQGNEQAAESLAEHYAAADGLALLESQSVQSLQCHGIIDVDLPEAIRRLVSAGSATQIDPATARLCLVALNSGYTVVLGMLRPDYRQWHIGWVRAV